MKDLSIVIITLNEEKCIQRILNNLLHQTYKRFEVIVIDSNSDDSTENEALKFQPKFDEFKFVNM
jgi:glycosyltransferase involved in cell wall biosynthesis